MGHESPMMLPISDHIAIPLQEVTIKAIRSAGPGGQNVNKVSSAVHLRFDIQTSSLPERYKQRLLRLKDRRISKDGIIVIKSQQHRSQEQNREEALQRLQILVQKVIQTPIKRKPTHPTRTSVQRRLNRKINRGRLKRLRAKVREKE
jgi:ribosome-associated protein